jgi:hypothetical protein
MKSDVAKCDEDDSDRYPVSQGARRGCAQDAQGELVCRHSAEGRPQIVCLCGSTRFYEQFMEVNLSETIAGRIVLAPGFFVHRPDTPLGRVVGCTPEQKVALDELHKRKIDLADEVYVLNVGGYIGESTRSEIE